MASTSFSQVAAWRIMQPAAGEPVFVLIGLTSVVYATLFSIYFLPLTYPVWVAREISIALIYHIAGLQSGLCLSCNNKIT